MYNKFISGLEGSSSVELMLKAEKMRKEGKRGNKSGSASQTLILLIE